MPDCAFSLAHLGAKRSVGLPAQLGLKSPFAAVTVRCIGTRVERDAFLDRLAQTLRQVLDRRLVHHLALVVQYSGVRAGDLRATNELAVRLDDRRVTLVSNDFSPQELMVLYSSAKFIVASRLHSAIFALVAGTPAVAFSIDGKKTEGVFDSLGLSDWVLPYPYFDESVALETISLIASDCGSARRVTYASARRARNEVSKANEALRAEVENILNARGAEQCARPANFNIESGTRASATRDSRTSRF
jgi:polysaccharide pyruvyl transferase WcaK-like protein